MRVVLHVVLLVVTFITTAFAGVQWLNRDPLELTNLSSGVLYASLLLAMLLSHEMGHYLAARHHKIDATLPYFIPFPSYLFYGMILFGTLGAVIRLKEPVRSRTALFDIGAAGPLAGAIVSVTFLAAGFLTLPPVEYLYTIHPDYATMASIPETGLTFGKSILYVAAEALFVRDGAFLPPMNEIYHYPFLCVGWFGLFVTSLNLLPVGQLDGGHIARSLLPRTARNVFTVSTFGVLVALGAAGLLPLAGVAVNVGWAGWLVWGLILAWMERLTRNRTSDFDDGVPLSPQRRIVGWICFALLALSFAPVPFSIL